MANNLPLPTISVVIPVFNEIKTIDKLVVRLGDALSELNKPFEIIFVDDNSTDGTYEYLLRYNQTGRVRVVRKKGKQGKAYSLHEGLQIAKGEIFIMIDGDLQYPPEAITEMVRTLETADIVVANRKRYHDSFLRKFMSKAFRVAFGRILFGLKTDIQSGLKAFKKEVFETVSFYPSSAWTIDLELLHKAKHAGFVIKNVDITFSKRENGNSHVKTLKTSWEIGYHALLLRLKKIPPLHIQPSSIGMIGAGIGYKRKRYITHTTLPHHRTALITAHPHQKVLLFLILSILALGAITNLVLTAQAIVALLSVIYFIDGVFNFVLVTKSLSTTQEITSSEKELSQLESDSLPVYTILCPLYREAHVVPQFIDAISNLDWPKNKLDVMLLLEEDDKETIGQVELMTLPKYVRIVVVPDSLPKTKPKACNYGLSLAKGDFLVVYDAEDIPDPLQLKKAYVGFQKVTKDVICLQAKLNYYNPDQNLLTRFFTAEYSLWFDITLTGLQSVGTNIPLGGTSNHFRTKDLLALQGWDPFNVTEDADLGVRLFKEGYKTAIIDSTTLEEANSRTRNWLRQRSRWLKGYMQTYLVHMRDIFSFARNKGIHSLLFQLTIGLKITFILINPILWITTILYFTAYSFAGPTIELLYPMPIFYLAIISMVFGNFLFFYYYMLGCAKRGQWSLMKYIFLIPIYWVLISTAAVVAFYQLIFKPHYWEKTVHGFHLKHSVKKIIPEAVIETEEQEAGQQFPQRFRLRLATLISSHKHFISGGSLVVASVLGNIINLVFNAYLGRSVDLTNFGLISLVTGINYITSIPFTSLGSSVNYRTGFLEGRFGAHAAYGFWKELRKRMFVLGFASTIVWLALTPVLMRYFAISDIFVFLSFAPMFLIGFVTWVDRGYISGRMMFSWLAVIAFVEPLVRFVATYILVISGNEYYAYSTIPLIALLGFVIGWAMIVYGSKKAKVTSSSIRFPFKFFIGSLLSGLAAMSFLSLDIILAKHFLSADDAGQYALVSLVGKMVFFLGTLASQFVVPIVSRIEGENKSTKSVFYKVLYATYMLTFIGFVLFGVFGSISVPLLLGERAREIVPYLLFICFAMMCFTVSKVFVNYYLTKKVYTFSVTAFILAIVQFFLITINHRSVGSIVLAMVITGGLYLVLMIVLHLNIKYIKNFESNLSDFLGLFARSEKEETNKLRILIFNWRDLRHAWSGGAEVYIHEIAKRWIQDGNHVTLFCGNYKGNQRNQVIDGVHIVRRGGFYTVYFWAFAYYMFRFRGKFDVIVDCENGIPFFTPLFSRKPIVLLIHHIHQEVFRRHLRFPFSYIAQILEAKLMPLIYRNKTIITVSESSRKEILKLGFTKPENIHIVNNGIDKKSFKRLEKTSYPLFTYLGRLRPYKNIDVAIRAFVSVVAEFPYSEFMIIGDGESFNFLQKLTQKLALEKKVTFIGRVSDSVKADLLAKSWVMVQPSMVEGWGITVIEANASGTPVIASNVSGLRDSIVNGKTGILVQVRNVDEFARAMKNIISDRRQRSTLSREAYFWSQQFDWDRSAKRFFTILKDEFQTNARKFAVSGIAVVRK